MITTLYKEAVNMKLGIDWSHEPPVDFGKLLESALIPESEYDPAKHGENLPVVNSIAEFYELFPEHLELNMAILRSSEICPECEEAGTT